MPGDTRLDAEQIRPNTVRPNTVRPNTVRPNALLSRETRGAGSEEK
jgi:hypothetical protein